MCSSDLLLSGFSQYGVKASGSESVEMHSSPCVCLFVLVSWVMHCTMHRSVNYGGRVPSVSHNTFRHSIHLNYPEQNKYDYSCFWFCLILCVCVCVYVCRMVHGRVH